MQGCWNAILEYANDKAIYVIAVGVAIGVVEVCIVYLFRGKSIDIYWIQNYYSNDIFITHVDFKNKLSSNVFVVEILSSENCLLKSWNYLFFICFLFNVDINSFSLWSKGSVYCGGSLSHSSDQKIGRRGRGVIVQSVQIERVSWSRDREQDFESKIRTRANFWNRTQMTLGNVFTKFQLFSIFYLPSLFVIIINL